MKAFTRLRYAATWRHSPTRSAIAIGKLRHPPMRPVDPRNMEGWVTDMVQACGGLIRQWLRQEIMVTVDQVTDTEARSDYPETVVPLKAFLAADPVQVMDNITGAILHQIGGRKFVPKHDPYRGAKLHLPHRCLSMTDLQQRYRDYEAAPNPHSSGVTHQAVVEALMNVMAAALGRRDTLDHWPGWDGFYASYSALLTDKEPLLVEQMESPTVNPLIRMVSALTARLNGIKGGTLPDKYERILDQVMAAHYRRSWQGTSKIVYEKCIKTIDEMVKGLAAIGELGVSRADPGCAQIHANWWGTFSRLPDPPEQGSNSGNSDQSETGEGDIEAPPPESAPESPPPPSPEQQSMRYMKGAKVHMAVTYDPSSEVVAKTRRKVVPFQLQYYDETRTALCNYQDIRIVDVKRRSLPIQQSLRNLLITVMRPPKPVYGFRSGDLDENALHSVSYDDRLFSRIPPEGEDKVEVILLLDCSGSMSGARMEATHDCAYAIANVLDSPRITLRIIGHTAYKQSGHVSVRLKEVTKDNLVLCYASGENADGYAIEYAAGMFKTRAKRKIIILIADGQPSVVHHYSGGEALQHTAKVVQSLPNRGIEFVCLGLDRCITDNVGRFMYGQRFIQVPAEGRELPSRVGRFLRDTLAAAR